jgi:hypothetical protein
MHVHISFILRLIYRQKIRKKENTDEDREVLPDGTVDCRDMRSMHYKIYPRTGRVRSAHRVV